MSAQKDKEEDTMIPQYREVKISDLSKCYQIESSSYPSDEAASLESLTYRCNNANDYFVVAEKKNQQIIGFICSTRCQNFNVESMSNHDPNGSILAIHSVVVEDSYRRKGVGTRMLRNYVEDFVVGMKKQEEEDESGIECIKLLAKANLLPFYVNAGFSVIRKSPIEHGKDDWFELSMDLDKKKKKKTPLGIPYSVVDSFTESYGGGNPAAVVMLPSDTSPAANDDNDDDDDVSFGEKWRSMVAKEFNLSETAFLWKREDSNNDEKDKDSMHCDIRYYSPTVEVDLCGHATLASAAVLFQQEQNVEEIIFHTNTPNVNLACSLAKSQSSSSDSNNVQKIAMLFPWKDTREFIQNDNTNSQFDAVCQMLSESFSITPSSIQYVGVGTDLEDILCEISMDAFLNLPTQEEVDYAPMLNQSDDLYTRGVILCCDSSSSNNDGDEGIDFYSRFFGPKAGINEDPVTGSAHCLLAPYFASRVIKKKKGGQDGMLLLRGKQMSDRTGVLECALNVNDVERSDDADTKEEEECDSKRIVRIVGSAVTAMSGMLHMK